jgi:hypothetical protein
MDPASDGTTSKAEVDAYMLNYFSALKTLEQIRDKYKKEAGNQSLPEHKQAVAVAAYLDMTSTIAHLTSAHDRILETYAGSAEAPPPELVKKSLELSRALGERIAAAATAVAVLEVATQFVDAWTALLNAKDGATAPAATKANAEAPPALADYVARLKTERMVRATNMEFLGLGEK